MYLCMITPPRPPAPITVLRRLSDDVKVCVRRTPTLSGGGGGESPEAAAVKYVVCGLVSMRRFSRAVEAASVTVSL